MKNVRQLISYASNDVFQHTFKEYLKVIIQVLLVQKYYE